MAHTIYHRHEGEGEEESQIDCDCDRSSRRLADDVRPSGGKMQISIHSHCHFVTFLIFPPVTSFFLSFFSLEFTMHCHCGCESGSLHIFRCPSIHPGVCVCLLVCVTSESLVLPLGSLYFLSFPPRALVHVFV